MKNFLIYVTIFMIGIGSFGCAPKEKTVTVQYEYVSCGKVDRKIDLEKESPENSLFQNHLIMTRNLQKMDDKLRETYNVIDCYEKQVKK